MIWMAKLQYERRYQKNSGRKMEEINQLNINILDKWKKESVATVQVYNSTPEV